MFEIRLAHATDSTAIQRVYLETIAPLTTSMQDLDQLIDVGGLLVAVFADQIIGFGGIDVRAKEQLKWLYVLSHHQGAGVGSALLQQLEDIGWSAGLRSFRLHAAPASVSFYRRHGFAPVAATELLGHDHDGVEMVKRVATV